MLLPLRSHWSILMKHSCVNLGAKWKHKGHKEHVKAAFGQGKFPLKLVGIWILITSHDLLLAPALLLWNSVLLYWYISQSIDSRFFFLNDKEALKDQSRQTPDSIGSTLCYLEVYFFVLYIILSVRSLIILWLFTYLSSAHNRYSKLRAVEFL